jgi:outer membrane receptor protein involved in Fe transport
VPNPSLKPEKTTKVYAGLQWYLNPAGILGVSAYRLDIDGLQMKNIQITAEQAEAQLGYPLHSSTIISDGEDGGGDFGEGGYNPAAVNYRSTINAEGTRTVYGLTIEYNQQFTFLPGYLKGLSAFGSFTVDSMKNMQIEEEKLGRSGRAANGGIRYRYGRFNVQLRAVWKDEVLSNIWRPTPGQRWFSTDHVYLKERTVVDLSGGFRLTKHMELSFSVRNITNSPLIVYSNVPGRVYQYQVYGSTWNLSLKGNF